MPVPFCFTIPDDEPYAAVPLVDCQRRLQDSSLSQSSRLALMRHQGRLLVEAGDVHQALDVLIEAIALQPSDPFSYAYKGWALEQLGQRKGATEMYRKTLSLLPEPNHPIAAQLWYRCGVMLRVQKLHKQSLTSYDRAIELQPDYAEAVSGRSVLLALMGRHKQAKQESDRALALLPQSPQILNNSGIVLMSARKYSLALGQFQAVLAQDPDFERAWYNCALALVRLGRWTDAMERLDRSLEQYQAAATFSSRRPPIPSWVISAWTLHAFLSLKSRHLTTTIHSSRQAQALDPDNYSAALYKITAIIGKGNLWGQVTTQNGRKELGHDLRVIANGLKYRLLSLVSIIAVLVWGEGHVIDGLRQYVPALLSLGIVGLVGLDLWRHKSRLRFVWKTYFGNGIVGSLLTYVRAVLTLIVTLVTFSISYHYAPEFMRWGWASAVFGTSSNIIFQPLNLIQDLSFHPLVHPTFEATHELKVGLHALLANVPLALCGNLYFAGLGVLGTPLFHIGHVHVTMASLLTALFWLALIVGVPFWAHLEEKIFRQGANNWKMITIRSVQFGLVHLLAGIPILGGFVLILPGFLFACRYKYVRDRHYRRHQDPQQADQAGVLASTADHAVYNAILMTLAISAMLLN